MPKVSESKAAAGSKGTAGKAAAGKQASPPTDGGGNGLAIEAARGQLDSIFAKAPKDNFLPELRRLAVAIGKPIFDPMNARLHPEPNMQAIMLSMARYGQRTPIVINKRTGHVLKGNGSLAALRRLGWSKVAAVWADDDELTAAGYGLADNRSAELAIWDMEMLARLQLMQEAGGGEEGGEGWSAEELAALRAGSWGAPQGPTEEELAALRASLAERFIVPPFSVLDARQGYWQQRKRAWLALGIQSEVGRGDNLLSLSLESRCSHEAGMDYNAAKAFVKAKRAEGMEDGEIVGAAMAAAGKAPRQAARAAAFGSGGPGTLAAGFKQGKAIPGGPTGHNSAYLFKQAGGGYRPLRELQQEEEARGEAAGLQFNAAGGTIAPGRNNRSGDGACEDGTQAASGTSIFDPVLCELFYRWFCPPKAAVLDPFAGGSVRGIVAAKLGLKYTGIDLSGAQIAANRKQAKAITPGNPPRWIEGDSLNVGKLAKGSYDGIFSCPPYSFLEVYSDHPADLSNMSYEEFREAYGRIIAASCSMLKADRFACFCVSEVRGKGGEGAYCGFVADTVRAFEAAGLSFYNEAILVTAVGSLSIRVGRQFAATRKLGRTHQNVLTFCKGSPRKAAEACGWVDVALPEGVELGEE